MRTRFVSTAASSELDEERYNRTLEGLQRNVLQSERNAHIHAYMRLPVVCVQISFCRHTVCTSTTVPLLPRRRFIRFGRHQRPRPLRLTESGRPACSAAEEARDARFATLCYNSLRISTAVVRKTRAFTRKIARIGISSHSFLERTTLNAQATAGHDTPHPSPYSLHSCRHKLSKAAEDVASPVRPKEKRSNLGAGIENLIFLLSRASIDVG